MTTHEEQDQTQDSTDTMILSLEKIAMFLERLIVAAYVCGALLGLISFLMLLRLMIGR
jgi:hypothetical protein